jgi:4-hydroxythreonine-4-phosphate dehydrogenase
MAESAHPRLALTAGEPAGIGYDLCALLAARPADIPARVVVIGDRHALDARAAARGLGKVFRDDGTPGAGLEVIDIAMPATVIPGRLDQRNGRSVLACLDRAIDGCLAGEFAAMVTAPVHKGVINDAGVAFTGHTEYLAERTRTGHVVMMLTGGGLRVALATTHLPLAAVPRAITREWLLETLRILDRDLKSRFGIAAPRILVAGLNPHGGESGHLGREEIDVITPAIEQAKSEGIAASGPYPADTLFTPAILARGDCALAMFHDQGLPVLKFASFGRGVNVTLGLPIIRTSVDHGTALDLAGQGAIDSQSLAEAIALAAELATHGSAH